MSKVFAFPDYLTFTFTPEPLMHLKALAKMGVKVKDERGILSPLEASRLLADRSGLEYCESAGMDYLESLQCLCEHVGFDMIDTICHGEIERFITRVNHLVTGDFGGCEWEIKDNGFGRFRYGHSANLLIEGVPVGLVCWGGSNLGCMVSLTGSGCQAVDMQALYALIKDIPGIKITRLDLAHDDIKGARGFDWAKEKAFEGGFQLGNRAPKVRIIESGELRKTGGKRAEQQKYYFKANGGRTLYVGARTSGKIYRCYEKGLQMGETNSKWVRHEVELHAKDRDIPLEAIIEPSKYFAGAYPCMAFLATEQSKIKTGRKLVGVSYQKVVQHAAKQLGRTINMMKQVGHSSDDIIERLTRHLDEFEIPKRMKFAIQGSG
ncbi:replication initiation factor domain-containing protein [Ferrimonas futtsuensis]|uniref:replication initiation factor domain-containing protein n=1 Tax=Ferrimonas futtsuensis TaxID=364764 RepID=UPI0004168761|nr:replication initiation factor domain-containing protein [Ferrimonas futtsuensis]